MIFTAIGDLNEQYENTSERIKNKIKKGTKPKNKN